MVERVNARNGLAASKSYSFVASNTPVTNIGIGSTVSGNLPTIDNQDVYTFHGTAGQRVLLDGLSGSFEIAARLTNPDGTTTSLTDLSDDSNVIALPQDGTYVLTIAFQFSFGDPGAGPYSFRLLDASSTTMPRPDNMAR